MEPITTFAIATGVAVIGGSIGGALTKDKPTQTASPDQRRTRDYYSRSSFSPDITKPLPALEPLQPLQPLQPLYNVAAVQNLRPLQMPTRFNWSSPYNYYSDPYQVNSIIDVLLNKKARDLVMKDVGWNIIPDWIPVLGQQDNVIVTGVDFIKRSYVDPIAGGRFKEAAMNAMADMGETLDAFSNPIKGLFIDGGKGFVRGLGTGAEGRTHYSFKVNSGINLPKWIPLLGGADVANMVLEAAVDPVTYLTMGAGKVAQQGAVASGKAMKRVLAAKFGGQVSEEIVQQTAKTFGTEYVQSLIKQGNKDAFKNTIKSLKFAGATDDVARSIVEQVAQDAAMQNMRNIVVGTYKVSQSVESIKRGLQYATPMGAAFAGAGEAIKWAKTVKNQRLVNLQKYGDPVVINGQRTKLVNFHKVRNDAVAQEIVEGIDSNARRVSLSRIYGDIKDMPQENLLISLYQEYRIYEGKTMRDFIDHLVRDDIITDDIAEQLLTNKMFKKLYKEVIKPTGDLFQAHYTAISNEYSLIWKRLEYEARSSKNKLEATIKANQVLGSVWKDFGEQGTNALKAFRDATTTNIKRLKRARLDLLKDGHDVTSTLVKTKDFQITVEENLLESFTNTVDKLGLSYVELPSAEQLISYSKLLKEGAQPADLLNAAQVQAQTAQQAFDTSFKNIKHIQTVFEERFLKAQQEIVSIITSSGKVENLPPSLVGIMNSPDPAAVAKAIDDLLSSNISLPSVDFIALEEAAIDLKNLLDILSDPEAITEERLQNWLFDPDNWEQLSEGSYSLLKETQNTLPIDVADFSDIELADLLSRSHPAVVGFYDEILTYRDLLTEMNHNNTALEQVKNYIELMQDTSRMKPLEYFSNNAMTADTLHTLREEMVKDLDAVSSKFKNVVQTEKIQQGTELHTKLLESVDTVQKALIEYATVRTTDADLSEAVENLIGLLQSFDVENTYQIRDLLESLLALDLESLNKTVVDNSFVIADSVDAVVILTELEQAISQALPHIGKYTGIPGSSPVVDGANNLLDVLTNIQAGIDVSIEELISDEVSKLSTDTAVYMLKMNQAALIIDTIKTYNEDKYVSGFLNDLATGSADTDIGALFNILKRIEAEPGLLSTDTANLVRSLSKTAQAHQNAEAFMNKLVSLQGVPQDIKIATLDWIAGAGYQDIDRFIKRISNNGVDIDINKLRDEIEYKINGLTNSGIRANALLHEHLGLGKVDESLLHDAMNDVRITGNVYGELIARGNVKMDDGEQFVVFDIETTGLRQRAGHQGVQIGAVKYEMQGGVPVEIDVFDEVIKLDPGTAPTARVRDLSPSLYDRVETAGRARHEVFKEFNEFRTANNARLKLVGHNVKDFDVPFLNASYAQGFDVGKVDDTLELSAKIFNRRTVSDELVNKIADTLTEYIRVQKTVSNKMIQLMDPQALNTVFDVVRGFEPFLKRFQNSRNRSDKFLAAQLEEIIQGTLNRKALPGVQQSDSVKNPELLDQIVDLDYDSFVTKFRGLYTDLKQTNETMRLKFITSDDLVVEYGGLSFKTNSYTFVNGRSARGELVNEYVFRDYSSKTIWRNNTSGVFRVDSLKDIAKLDIIKVNKAMHQVDRWIEYAPSFYEISASAKQDLVALMDTTFKTNPLYQLVDNPAERTLTELYAIYEYLKTREGLQDTISTVQIDNIFQDHKVRSLSERVLYEDTQRDLVREAFADLQLRDSDDMTRERASQTIAESGKNADQIERLYYTDALINGKAKDTASLPDRVNATMTLGRNETKEYFSSNVEMAKTLANVDEATTNSITNQIAINETNSILQADPTELASFMYHEAPVIQVFKTKDKEYSALVEDVLKNAETYRAAGIVVEQDGEALILKLAIDYTPLDDVSYNFIQYELDLSDVEDTAVKDLLHAQQESYMRSNKIRERQLPFNAHTRAVRTTNAQEYMTQYDRLSKKIKKGSILESEQYRKQFLKRKDPMHNYLNIGDSLSRKAFDSRNPDVFRNTMTMLEQTTKRVDGRNKLIELNFNKDLGLQGPIWHDLSDEELLGMFQENKYMTAMVLTEKKGKPFVENFVPTSLKDMAELRRLDAVIATQEHANGVMNSINKLEFDSNIAQWYYKYIVGTYKTIYVSSVGLVTRNFLDIIAKNLVGGTPYEIPTTMYAFWEALKDYREYNNMVGNIYKEYGTMTSRYVDLFFENNPQYNKALFDEIHAYATSNISAGMATVQQEALKSYYIDNTDRSRGAELYDKVVYENNIITQNLMDINTQVEHAGRLSKLRLSQARGMNSLEAYDSVLRAHFDYSSKTKAMMHAELLFPFVTFPLYNLPFWIDAVQESPWMMQFFLNQSRTSLELEEQTQFYIDHSMKFQNAFLNGNIKIGDTLFKTSPSIFDAYNLVIAPVEEMYSRVVAPLRVKDLVTEQKDIYGDVIEFDTKMTNYLKNVTAVYQLVERPGQVVANVLSPLGIKGELNIGNGFVRLDTGKLESIADVVPSLAKEWKQKHGTKIGDRRPISTRRAYSTQRIPYVKRYYSSSYNFYNRWKAQRAAHARALRNVPPTPESTQARVRGILLQNRLTVPVAARTHRQIRSYYN